MMFIWIILIGVIAYVLIDKGNFKWDKSSNPMNLLDERLARGEVTLEEYIELKDQLRRL